MTDYSPPTRETLFILNHVVGIADQADIPAFAAVDEELAETLLEEAGRFCAEVIAPLNVSGDQAGCTRHADGSVTTPPGYREAYARYVEAGWGTLALAEDLGGQGLPHVLATAVEEYMNSSCHAFNMYPGLTHGAVAALAAKGSEMLKTEYLPRLVSGEWLGTMALTEAHAGTDLGLIRTRALPQGDGSWRIEGEKIFCSGGEHDLTDNIVHLVLARTPDAPAGPRGISLFVVPKFLPDGARNAATCGAIEHKMGVHGSATCVMNFDGATGWLVGAENEGLAAMFIMMNAARLSCGNQGLAQAELAYQKASAYAQDRRQGRGAGARPDPSQAADPIVVHPDVRRMLLDARAFIDSFRALVAWTAVQIDRSHFVPDEAGRADAEALVAFLTPVIKAYGTDRGFETAVAMQQVFGGHGYVAEWGMEQIVRDARVAMIYEGANGVQAMDLVGRKLVRDGGAVAERFFAMVEAECDAATGSLAFLSVPLTSAVREGREAARWLLSAAGGDANQLGAGSYAFLKLIGLISLGWMWLRIAAAAQALDDDSTATRVAIARHFAARQLPDAASLRQQVEAGGDALMVLPPEAFTRG